MSSILKALKKVEESKVEPQEGAANLSRDILKSGSKVKRAENWILPTAIAALVLTASMLTYVLAGGFGVQDKKPQALAPATVVDVDEPVIPVVIDRPEALFAGTDTGVPQATTDSDGSPAASDLDAETHVAMVREKGEAAQADAAKVPVDAVQTPKTETVAPKEVAVVAKENLSQAKKATIVTVQEPPVAAKSPQPVAKASPPAPVEKAPPAKPAATAPTRTVAKMETQSKDRPEPAVQSAPTATATAQPSSILATRVGRMPTGSGNFPALHVSEIHYQWEVTDRLAVVNDLPVMEGTVIEGARVDRILRDRVRFLHNGQYREVRLNTGTN